MNVLMYFVWTFDLENNNEDSKSYNHSTDLFCTHFTARALTMNEQNMIYLIYNTNTTRSVKKIQPIIY